MIKTRPILFSGPMVLALLAGRKTQSRRIVKGRFHTQPVFLPSENLWSYVEFDGSGEPAHYIERDFEVIRKRLILTCPYGKAGDRLWVRETIWQWGKWAPNGKTKTGKPKHKFVPIGRHVVYVADHPSKPSHIPAPAQELINSGGEWIKRPAIFMPRWASRLTLELTGIRVERLQDISGEDAITEGLTVVGTRFCQFYYALYGEFTGGEDRNPRFAFETLWESINGAESWAANPWVWVLELKVVEYGATQE